MKCLVGSCRVCDVDAARELFATRWERVNPEGRGVEVLSDRVLLPLWEWCVDAPLDAVLKRAQAAHVTFQLGGLEAVRALAERMLLDYTVGPGDARVRAAFYREAR